MAGLLQRLSAGLVFSALAGASLAGQTAPAFSHRLHLKMKLECVNCHTSAPSSTRLEDNNLPAKAVCLPCHEEAVIKRPRATKLARFNHAKHLKLGNIAGVIAAAIDHGSYLSPPGDIRRHLNTGNPCVACHRGLEESDAVTSDALPRMADCLVCHSQIDPPYSCKFCHGPDQDLKPASHTPDYVDLHSSPDARLDKSSCAVCHGRRFTCQGCH